MTDLSPAAQAMLDACDQAFNQCGTTAQGLATALRAAANDWRVNTEFIDGVEYIRTTTLEMIVAELEDHD